MKTNLLVLLMLLIIISPNLKSQNYGLHLDGADDKIGILDSPELNPNDALTIEAWIKADSWATSIWAGVIAGKQGTNPDKGYAFTCGESGRVEFTHSIDESWNAVSTPQILGLNTWYHVAGVYDGTSMKLYVNGILQSSADVSGTPTLGTDVVLNFGDNPTWPGRFFHGTLDEMRIWETARTEQEIQDNMTVELTGSEPGLVGYWNMNEGTGTSISDISGNGNTGTLLNMGEDAWVEGFTPPGNDVGVIGIASPSKIGSGFTSEEYVKIDIKNFATDEVSDFDVSYQIDDGEVVTETVNITIPPFGTYIYSFSEPVDLSGVSEIDLHASTALENDSNPGNDALTETISQTNNYFLFDQEQHNYGGMGQSHTTTLYMPSELTNYSQILMHVDLGCPPGGCDPWDQPAKINILKDGISYEIARYITPFGVACGDWVFDITDFRSVLTNKVEFQSYVQVWGASGWLVTIELEMIPGIPDYPYVKLTRLWNEDNWVYGDPDISYNFPEKTINIANETEAMKIRMTMSGHGQGNTLNAAEFAEFTHHIWVNNEETFAQHLWKTDCDDNACSPQNGTYLFSRAGWCPGQDIQPWEWWINDFTPATDITLDYVLADYTNLLNTGYNGSTHTEPHFRCHTYLLEYSTDEFVGMDEQQSKIDKGYISVYPNPSTGIVNITTRNKATIEFVKIYRIDGNQILDIEVSSGSYQAILEELPAGLYILRVDTDKGSSVMKISLR